MEFAGTPHYKTSDKPLALALHTAGCEFVPPEEGGPAMNKYTPQFLRARKLLTSEKVTAAQFEARGMEAFSKGIPGHVFYIFRKTEKLESALKAWSDLADRLIESEEEGTPVALPEISAEVAMQVACMLRYNEKEFKKAPFFRSPLFETSESTRRENGQEVVKSGKGKLWSHNLNAQARKELKIGV